MTHPTPSEDRRYRLRGRIAQLDHSFLLEPGENRVGSAEDNDLLISVPGVSRRHARLSWDAAGLVVVDLGSRNGTLVNGQAVDRCEVQAGDRLRFGPVELGLEEIDAGDAELGIFLDLPRSPRPFSPDQSTEYQRGSPVPEARGPVPFGR